MTSSYAFFKTHVLETYSLDIIAKQTVQLF